MEKQKTDFIEYLGWMGNSPHTIKKYDRDITQFIEWCADHGVRNVADVTPQIIRGFVSDLHDVYATSTIAHLIFTLHSWGDFLVKDGKLTRNVFKRIGAPKMRTKLPHPLTFTQMSAVLTEVWDNPRNRAIVEILYGTGMRISEMMALTPGDINWEDRTIRVIGKGNKERLVMFGRGAAAALSEYLDDAEVGTDDPLFDMHPNTVRYVLAQAGKNAAIPFKVTPHTLRHTFSTHMLEGGSGLRVLQELLGHESPGTTIIYAAVTTSHARDVVTRCHPYGGGV
jgi:site-specific recombinase XerD